MRQLTSLIQVLWKPDQVLSQRTAWTQPYLASALLIGLLGMYTRSRLAEQIVQQLQGLGATTEGIDLFGTGSYLGIIVVALVMPMVIPWLASFVSKFIALFSGSHVTFSEFFSIYQWGYYVSTLFTVILKGSLFMMLPVESWGSVTLSPAAVLPDSPRIVATFAATLDLSLIILFLVAFAVLKGRRQYKELTIPVWALITFVVVQASFSV